MKQRTEEWFESRKTCLTASNFGTALGLNPYQSRQKLWRQLTGLQPAFEGNEFTKRGEKLESFAKQSYEVQSGILIEDTGFHIHSVEKWLGASPDGLVEDYSGKGLVEIKCPMIEIDLVKPMYFAQMQGQMEVMGRGWCDFFAWSPEINARNQIVGTDWFFKIRVRRDKEWWVWALPILREFWECVQGKREPKKIKKESKL